MYHLRGHVSMHVGVSMRAMFMDMDESVDRRVMQVNYFAPRVLTKAVLPGN